MTVDHTAYLTRAADVLEARDRIHDKTVGHLLRAVAVACQRKNTDAPVPISIVIRAHDVASSVLVGDGR